MNAIVKTISCFILIVFTINEQASVLAQQICYTPYGERGLCVSLQNCNIQGINRWEINNFICKGGNWNQLNICCEMSNLKQQEERPFRFTSSNNKRFKQQVPEKQDQPPFKGAGFNFPRQNNIQETRPFWSQSTITKAPTVPKNTEETTKGLNSKGLNILNSVKKCGYIPTRYIAFGENANLGEFPFMALLKYNAKVEFQCGGTLITDRYVLTAAHCVTGLQNELIGVRLGEHTIGTEKDCAEFGRNVKCFTHEDFGIDKIISHPSYSPSRLLNDIALIKLDRNVPKVRNINPICLPITEVSKTIPKINYITGWGLTENNIRSETLQKATINYISRSTCQNIFKRFVFTDNHFCAGSDGSVNTCRGDSGGPLFFRSLYNENTRYVQYGIVSLGSTKCGDEPSIFTSVIDLLPWITDNID